MLKGNFFFTNITHGKQCQVLYIKKEKKKNAPEGVEVDTIYYKIGRYIQ